MWHFLILLFIYWFIFWCLHCMYKLPKVRWCKLSESLSLISGESCFVFIMVPFAILAAYFFTFMRALLHSRGTWECWGSGCKARCHWNLSHSSLSLILLLSVAYIYKTLSISVQFVTAMLTPLIHPRNVTFVLGRVVIYSHVTSAGTHILAKEFHLMHILCLCGDNCGK